MPRGKQPSEYFKSEDVDKSIADIYKDFDSFTHETFADDAGANDKAWLKVIVPPVFWRGRFIKGLCMSPAVDFIIDTFPQTTQLFVSIATSMSIAYPWSLKADAYLCLYDNPSRERWFQRNTIPSRSEKTLLPWADADYSSEARFAPLPGIKRCVDVLTVSMLWTQRNVPMIAEAVTLLAQRKALRSWTLIIGRPEAELDHSAREELGKVEAVISSVNCNFDLIYTTPPYLINQFYARAKCYVFGSLFEGSNRSIKEAMLADTPVVCFEKYNHYARGNTPVIPEGAGLTSGFSVHDLADTIEQVLSNPSLFSPRESFLKSGGGRKNFFRHCIERLPYFEPYLHDSSDKRWWNMGCKELYGVDLEEYLLHDLENSGASGIDNIGSLLTNFAVLLEKSGWKR